VLAVIVPSVVALALVVNIATLIGWLNTERRLR
jgi:hypothetical protein